jgi:hypothetical protein
MLRFRVLVADYITTMGLESFLDSKFRNSEIKART